MEGQGGIVYISQIQKGRRWHVRRVSEGFRVVGCANPCALRVLEHPCLAILHNQTHDHVKQQVAQGITRSCAPGCATQLGHMTHLKKGVAHGIAHQVLQMWRRSLSGIVLSCGRDPFLNLTGCNAHPLQCMDEGGWVLGQVDQGLSEDGIEGRPHIKEDNSSRCLVRMAGCLVCFQEVMGEVSAEAFTAAQL